MKLPKYQLKSRQELSTYEVVSEGPKVIIIKRTQFTLINEEQVYNLGFADNDPVNGEIENIVISNNNDSVKVFATVIAAVFPFCDKHPGVWIFATGSTKSRTRLYQIGIAKYIEEIKPDLDLHGEINQEWEPFDAGKNYTSFLAKRKIA